MTLHYKGMPQRSDHSLSHHRPVFVVDMHEQLENVIVCDKTDIDLTRSKLGLRQLTLDTLFFYIEKLQES
jgi:hypothetical protein